MNKPSLTLVEIAEMASGANTELPDGLSRAAPNLYVQIRGESASYVLRWYRGSHVSTMGLGSLRKVTFDEATRQAAFAPQTERSAGAVTAAAIDWLGQGGTATGPFFLWVHYFDPPIRVTELRLRR